MQLFQSANRAATSRLSCQLERIVPTAETIGPVLTVVPALPRILDPRSGGAERPAEQRRVKLDDANVGSLPKDSRLNVSMLCLRRRCIAHGCGGSPPSSETLDSRTLSFVRRQTLAESVMKDWKSASDSESRTSLLRGSNTGLRSRSGPQVFGSTRIRLENGQARLRLNWPNRHNEWKSLSHDECSTHDRSHL